MDIQSHLETTVHRPWGRPSTVGSRPLTWWAGCAVSKDRLIGMTDFEDSAPAKAPCEKFDIAAPVAWAELLVPSPVTV